MSETPKKEGPFDPGSIPKSERIGTITVIWTKSGKIHMQYPQENHISFTMLAALMKKMAENETQRHQEVKSLLSGAPSSILPATLLPAVGDPRFRIKS